MRLPKPCIVSAPVHGIPQTGAAGTGRGTNQVVSALVCVMEHCPPHLCPATDVCRPHLPVAYHRQVRKQCTPSVALLFILRASFKMLRADNHIPFLKQPKTIRGPKSINRPPKMTKPEESCHTAPPRLQPKSLKDFVAHSPSC